jgi:hypothetical protein
MAAVQRNVAIRPARFGGGYVFGRNLIQRISNLGTALAKASLGPNGTQLNGAKLNAALNRLVKAAATAAATAAPAAVEKPASNANAKRRGEARFAIVQLKGKLEQFLGLNNSVLVEKNFTNLANNIQTLNKINNSNLNNSKNSNILSQLKLKYRIMNSVKNSKKTNATALTKARALIQAVDALAAKVRQTSNLGPVRANLDAFKALGLSNQVNLNKWAKNQQVISNGRARRSTAPSA